MTQTDIDIAHAAMTAAEDDDAARLRFYERVADAELFILLAGDPDGDQVEPELFDISDQKFALIFDREERLAAKLRENLRRRKVQTREMRESGDTGLPKDGGDR